MEYNGEKVLTESALVDIMQQEMSDIVETELIYIQNQNFRIPNDKKTRIAVNMVDGKVIANHNGFETTDTGITEKQEVLMRENVQIDIFSRSNVPILHRTRILMALNSLFAKELQERYNFKIYKVPTSFVNSASDEGGSRYNRFTITVPCLVWYKREVADPSTGYYDKFPSRVDDEETIGEAEGLIEFEVKEEV